MSKHEEQEPEATRVDTMGVVTDSPTASTDLSDSRIECPVCFGEPIEDGCAECDGVGSIPRCPTCEELIAALKAATGYMENARIDLRTGAPKQTATDTLTGGLAVIRAAIAKAEAHS